MELLLSSLAQFRQSRVVMGFDQRGQLLTLILIKRRRPAASVRERIWRASLEMRRSGSRGTMRESRGSGMRTCVPFAD